MKNAFGGLISRLDTAEERISELEDWSIEFLKTESLREQTLKKKTGPEPPRAVGQLQRCNTRITRTPEGEEREEGTEKILETIMTDNLLKLMSETKPQTQEIQRTSSRPYVKNLHMGR